MRLGIGIKKKYESRSGLKQKGLGVGIEKMGLRIEIQETTRFMHIKPHFNLEYFYDFH